MNANPLNSRRFHAGIGTIARTFSDGKETTCNHECQIKVPRRRRWSPKKVAEIFDFTLSGSLDAPPEPGNHSWGKHPEPFIDDGDDHRSSRVPSSLTWTRQTRDTDFKGQSGRGIERPPKLVIRMSRGSTLSSGNVDGTYWSWESRTQFRKILYLHKQIPFPQRFPCSIQARATPSVWMVVPPRPLRLTSSVKKMVWRWVLATLQALTNEDRRPVTFPESPFLRM